MAKKVFFSFHFDGDHWRASQVRQIGAIEGSPELSDNDWEAVKKKGDGAIKAWIDNQLSGRSCAIVLVGQQTANRPWIDYEIKKAWEMKKGLVGIRIHGLKDADGYTSNSGANPFEGFAVGTKPLTSIIMLFNPTGFDSKTVYASISENIGALVDEAIRIRAQY